MKNYLIALAVLGTALLSSCIQEKSFDVTPLGENDIAFVMSNSATRSADATSAAVKGVTLKFGTTPDGEPLVLEETIEELNAGPATKGAPAYTTNVGTVYETMGVFSPTTSFGDVIYEVMDKELTYDHNKDNSEEGLGWRYRHNYNVTPWPNKTDKVDFYLRMPAAGTNVTGLAYDNVVNSSSDKTVSFTLASPETAVQQQDILFGFTSISKNEHDHYLPNGAPVTMYHALSGVKFRNGHTNENQTKTIITKVEFVGLVDNGSCVMNPADGTVEWTAGDLSTDTEGKPFVFYQDFTNPTYVKNQGAANSDGTVDFTGSSTSLQLPNTSWTSAAADHNLNADDGSFTFWFIPQTISDDVTLKVTFRIKTPETIEGTEIPITINFGRLVNANGPITWQAGQLRTYTLKPFDVDVMISDKMEDPMIKSDLHVANTGNVDEYVRLLIMGNWYGWKPGTTAAQMAATEPSILVGYKYKGDEPGLTDKQKSQMVLPWYREGYPCTDPSDPDTCDDTLDPKTHPSIDPYGHFDPDFTLAKLGDRDGEMNDWADASGGFYYTAKIGPGAGTLNTNAVTRNLFESYTLERVPTIYLPSGNGREPAVGVHLVMEIVIQAIGVPKKKVTENGEEVEKDVWWLEAWYEATQVDKLHPNSMKNGEYRNALYRDHFKAGDYGDVVYDKYVID